MAYNVIWAWDTSYRGISFQTAVKQDSTSLISGFLTVTQPQSGKRLLKAMVVLTGGTFTDADAAGWAAQAQAAINAYVGG